MHLIGFAESNYLPSAFDNEVLSDGFCQRPRGSESHGCRHPGLRGREPPGTRSPGPAVRTPTAPGEGGEGAARGCWAQHQPCGTAGPAAAREGAGTNLVPVAKRGPGAAPPLLLSPCSHSVPTSLLRVPQPSPESWRCWPCRSLGALAADPSSCSAATGHSGSLLPPPRAPRVVLPGTVAEGFCCTGSNACSAPLPKPFCPCSHPIKLMEVGSVRGCSTHSAPSPGSPLPDPGMGHGGCPEPPTRRLPPILGLQPGATRREQTLGSSAGATTPQPPASPSHRAPPRGCCVGADGHRDVQPGRLRPSGPGHRGGPGAVGPRLAARPSCPGAATAASRPGAALSRAGWEACVPPRHPLHPTPGASAQPGAGGCGAPGVFHAVKKCLIEAGGASSSPGSRKSRTGGPNAG